MFNDDILTEIDIVAREYLKALYTDNHIKRCERKLNEKLDKLSELMDREISYARSLNNRELVIINLSECIIISMYII